MIASPAFLVAAVLLYSLVLQYPKCIKSVDGPDGLSAQLHVRPHSYHPLYIPSIMLGDPHDNLEMHLIVKDKGDLVKSECLIQCGDMVIDHDDTELVWNARHLTVTEEHSKNVIEYDF